MDLSDILNEVKSFIIANKLILYGGMAVDFALKHKGLQGIYDKDETPDYDFYTYKMEMAYELCQNLMTKYSNMNVINAFHPQTLRVRYGKIVVADISFMPKFVFDTIPTVNFIDTSNNPKGELLRVIHPKFKMADSHKAFLSPTRGTPNEAIFHRFKKDMDRFNLLEEAYPDFEIIRSEQVKIPLDYSKEHIMSGILAYVLIAQEFDKLNLACEYLKPVINGDEAIVEKLDELKPIFIVDKVEDQSGVYRAPFMDDLLPRSLTTDKAVYFEYASTITYHQISKYKVVNIHGLMLYFLTKSFMAPSYKKSPYHQYYVSLKNMIKAVQEPFLSRKIKTLTQDSPFFINMNLATEIEPPEYLIKIHEAYNRQHQIKEYTWPLPQYYPNNSPSPPTIKPHILLHIGYEKLNDFEPYRDLLKYGSVF